MNFFPKLRLYTRQPTQAVVDPLDSNRQWSDHIHVLSMMGDKMPNKVAGLLDDDSTSIADESDDEVPHYYNEDDNHDDNHDDGD